MGKYHKNQTSLKSSAVNLKLKRKSQNSSDFHKFSENYFLLNLAVEKELKQLKVNVDDKLHFHAQFAPSRIKKLADFRFVSEILVKFCNFVILQFRPKIVCFWKVNLFVEIVKQ